MPEDLFAESETLPGAAVSARSMAVVDELNEIAVALVAAWGEMPDIPKGNVAVTGKYSYSYADLASILALVRPVLAKHGLAVVQDVGHVEGWVKVTTRVLHRSGQTYTFGPISLPGGGTPQSIGGSITYARRYGLLAALGITAGGDDDDGQSFQAAPVRPVAEKYQPSVRSAAEQSIRTMIRGLDDEHATAFKEAFKERFGNTLAGLPVAEHDDAHEWTLEWVEQIDPVDGDTLGPY